MHGCLCFGDLVVRGTYGLDAGMSPVYRYVQFCNARARPAQFEHTCSPVSLLLYACPAAGLAASTCSLHGSMLPLPSALLHFVLAWSVLSDMLAAAGAALLRTLSQATDLRRRADAHSNSIAELEARMNREALSGMRSIDQYAMAKVQQEDLKQKIATDKAALAKLTPPAPAVAVGKAAGGLVGLQAGAGGSQSLHAGMAAAAAAKASAAAAGRVAQPIMVQGGLGVLQQQQLLLQHQFSQLPVQQQLAFQMLQQRQMPAYQAALQQQQQQQQLLNLLAAQKKTQP